MGNQNGINKAFKIVLIVAVVVIGLGISGLYALRSNVNLIRVSNEKNGYNLPGGSMTDLSEEMMGTSVATDSFESQGVFSENSRQVGIKSMPASAPETIEKKVIKNGSLSLKVDNVDESAEEISQIAKSNGGDISSSNFYQSGKNLKSGYVTVKVPASNFEKAYSQIKKTASLVVRESTSGSDVTEEYLDLQAQLRNKQAEEQAFQRIMDQAQKIDDILAVQAELSRVRGEIEQLQGRIKYLDSQADMATIMVNLSEDAEIAVVDRWRPWQVAKESINDLIKKAQNFVDLVIRLVITAIPILILYGFLILAAYKVGRSMYFRFRKKE